MQTEEALKLYHQRANEFLMAYPDALQEFNSIWKRNMLGAYGYLDDFCRKEKLEKPAGLRNLDEQVFWTLY